MTTEEPDIDQSEDSSIEPCNYCGKNFARSLGRICHIRSCHPEELVFTCPNCDVKYDGEESFIKHQEKWKGQCDKSKQEENDSVDECKSVDMDTNVAVNPVDTSEIIANTNLCDNVNEETNDILNTNDNMNITDDMDRNDNMNITDDMDRNDNMNITDDIDRNDNMNITDNTDTNHNNMKTTDDMDVNDNMDATDNIDTDDNMTPDVGVKSNVDDNISTEVKLIADSNIIAESLLQDVDNNVPLKCAQYATIHGKHAAQLVYLQRYPNMKISWERITSWITANGLAKKYNENNARFFRGQRPEIPAEIRKECTEAALKNGCENAQIKFTMKYNEYIFPPYLIKKWVYDAKNPIKSMQDSTDGPMSVTRDIKVEKLYSLFPETFLEFVKNEIDDIPIDCSDEEFLELIRSLINEHNSKAKSEEQINIEGTSSEVLLSLKDIKTKGRFSCRGCKSMYNRQEELTKHKLKCWVPDFEESGLTRSQRACRTKPIKDEPEEINEGESENEEHLMELATHAPPGIWTCGECKIEFGTKRQMNEHRRLLHKDNIRTYKRRSTIDNHDFKKNKKSEQIGLFTCSKCSRAYISKLGLCDHMRVTHDIWVTEKMEEISLRCEQCEKLCFNYDALMKHSKDCTNEPVNIEYHSPKVPEDFLKFNDVALLKPILFICPRCYVRFSSLEILGNHYIAKTCTRVPRPTDPDYVKT